MLRSPCAWSAVCLSDKHRGGRYTCFYSSADLPWNAVDHLLHKNIFFKKLNICSPIFLHCVQVWVLPVTRIWPVMMSRGNRRVFTAWAVWIVSLYRQTGKLKNELMQWVWHWSSGDPSCRTVWEEAGAYRCPRRRNEAAAWMRSKGFLLLNMDERRRVKRWSGTSGLKVQEKNNWSMVIIVIIR